MTRKENSSKKRRRRVIALVLSFILIVALGLIVYISIFMHSISAPKTPGVRPEAEAKVNVLVIGIANGLSDTLLLCSYDPTTNNVKMVSIPRDTYYPRPGYEHPAQKKINAAYGSEGAQGAVKSVEGLTGIKINYYIKLDYNGVEQIVDALGGLKITVPYNMDYDDPADNLSIHFEKGTVVEKGSDIVKVLRWRKNNLGKGGYAEGDIGRINMQHEVIRLGMEKILRGNIPLNILKLQKPLMENLKTNTPPDRMVYYLSKLNNIKEENITIETLPGEAKDMEGLSFFIVDYNKMSEMLADME